MSFKIIRNDITKVKADAIVNTANPRPTYSDGTDRAIYEAAGKNELLAARKKIGEIERGAAVETAAFKLDAKYIIHTVGPMWQNGEQGEFETLRNCYENCLKLALKLQCKSIAFPLIATGSYGFPKDKALKIALSTIQDFLLENEMEVILVVFDNKAFKLSGSVVESIREYVDANYVEEANEKEYLLFNCPSGRNSSLREREMATRRRREAINPNQYVNDTTPVDKKVSIDDLLATYQKTWQEKLFEYIDEKQLTGPQVYKNYISKQLYSKIQADKNYRPTKYTALALCLSLNLDLEQTQDLMGRAGWAFNPSNKVDVVVQACIQNKVYNPVRIDAILFDYECGNLDKIK